MIYPHTVSFREPTITQLPSGQESRSYTDAPTLSDLPARIIPTVGTEEDATERMVLERDLFTIVVKGDQPIERPMRAVSDYLDLELSVIKVQRPVLYRSPATYATIVTAERITTGTEDGQSG